MVRCRDPASAEPRGGSPRLSPLRRAARETGGGVRVLAQVSLGEILRPKGGASVDRDVAVWSIDGKRLDLAVFNRFGPLAPAPEKQGSGHCRETSFLRDAVKREAVRKAGAAVVQVERDDTMALVEQKVRDLLHMHLRAVRSSRGAPSGGGGRRPPLGPGRGAGARASGKARSTGRA
ncbi:MAG: DUF2726 domain-containing protein [Pseudomonadota bacterium]